MGLRPKRTPKQPGSTSTTSNRDGEHWFDRLAASPTRREALKAALAGVALTLPLIRSSSRQAVAGDDCFKGCVWTANYRYHRGPGWTCAADEYKDLLWAGATGSVEPEVRLVANLLLAPSAPYCLDRKQARWRQEYVNCLKPGCGGYDPWERPWGACGYACPTEFCFPCQREESGYVCCGGSEDCCSRA